jgi:hypothetical protein
MCGNNDHVHEPRVKRNQTVVDLEETIDNATVPTVGNANSKPAPGTPAQPVERAKRTNG